MSGIQLSHNSEGGPCTRCGVRHSSKTAYLPCFEEGDRLETWVARHVDTILALKGHVPDLLVEMATEWAKEVVAHQQPSTSEFRRYRRSQIAELRTWEPGDDMSGVSISAEDAKAGSPKAGDMIARNPKNHADQWLVAAAYFADNFEPIG